jgi:hypothetical protein
MNDEDPFALAYDPTATIATLTTHKNGDWLLWTLRPDGAPGTPHLATRERVGTEIGDTQLSDVDAVVGYFERRLIGVGYSIVRDGGPMPDDHLAIWTLAPGSN